MQRVGREGKRIRTKALDVRVLASPLAHSRIGIVVPRYRHSAVDRNRVKRRLRELVRLEILPLLNGESLPIDAVLRATPAAYATTFADLRSDIGELRQRLVRKDTTASR